MIFQLILNKIVYILNNYKKYMFRPWGLTSSKTKIKSVC